MKLLTVCLSEAGKAIVQSMAKADLFQHIETANDFFAAFEGFKDGDFSVILCEMKADSKFVAEAAQVLRSQCPSTPSFCVSFDPTIFSKKALLKNGFSDAFILPLDRQPLLEAIAQSLSPEALARRQFKRVRIPDLKPGTCLPFPTYIYLPLNNKYVVFTGKSEVFSEKKAEKLQAYQVGSLFVDQKDAPAFFEYLAEQLKGSGAQISETERQDKMQLAIRDLFHEIFNPDNQGYDSGRELLDSCRALVSTYITGKGEPDWYARLLKTIGGQPFDYSHSADVSTIAALFGMGLGSKKVEDLAIAGFLHDISLAQFPHEYGFEVNPAWSEADQQAFREHPLKTVNLLKTKKMIISDDVELMILQHHEKFSGGGFPKNLVGDKIAEEAQILSLADLFFDLTSVRPGTIRLKPVEALETVEKMRVISPELLRRARKLMSA